MSETKAVVVGSIKIINDTQTFDSGFSKRDVVITSSGQYPKDIKVHFTKEKCSLIDMFNVGQLVEVQCNIDGSEYNGKYYVNLVAWKINTIDGATQSETPKYQAPTHQEPKINPPTMTVEEEDDLPF
jgi:hypothetical protein